MIVGLYIHNFAATHLLHHHGSNLHYVKSNSLLILNDWNQFSRWLLFCSFHRCSTAVLISRLFRLFPSTFLFVT